MSKPLYNPVGYTFAAETQGKKKKKLDNLSKCALAAQAAGMTYGKYMAQVHPPSGAGEPEAEDAETEPPTEKRYKEECLFNPEVRCPDATKCASCGWAPMVAARRKWELRRRLLDQYRGGQNENP